MAVKWVICVLLFTSLATALPNPSRSVYQAIGVQNQDTNAATDSGGFLDIAFALMPQIEALVKNVTQNSAPATLQETERFQSFISLFIPVLRKTLQFRAEDQGRTIKPEDLEMLDLLEFALQYISDVALSGGSVSTHDAGVHIPDYTDLLPDYTADFTPEIQDINIPAVVIPEQKIPDFTVPKIEIPGAADIPAKKFSFESIPEVVIPSRNIAVTSAPLYSRAKTTKAYKSPRTTPKRTTTTTTTAATRTTASPTTEASNLNARDNIFRRVSPSSILRQHDFSSGRISSVNPAVAGTPQQSVVPFRLAAPSVGEIDRALIYHSLPGGGYFYRSTHN